MDNNFKPLELNEENVNAVFDFCYAPEGHIEDEEHFCADSPFSEELGYDEDSPLLLFSKEKALSMKETILYLLGQVKDIENKKYLTPDSLLINYKGKRWTENKDVQMKFIYLTDLAVLDIISLFINLDFSNSAKIIRPIKKTLSPFDENFKDWFKSFK